MSRQAFRRSLAFCLLLFAFVPVLVAAPADPAPPRDPDAHDPATYNPIVHDPAASVLNLDLTGGPAAGPPVRSGPATGTSGSIYRPTAGRR